MSTITREDLLERIETLAPVFGERAAEGDEARAIPRESVDELLAAGLARTLTPRRFGGWELGLETWFEAVRMIAAQDASHAWCAALIAHHPHYVAQMAEGAQTAVWEDGPDVAICGSVLPVCEVVQDGAGYRVSGRSPFASGVLHSSWAWVGGFLPVPGPPQWALFLLPESEYEVVDDWQTVGMRGTGSNLIVTDGAFAPDTHVIRISDLVNGTGPGCELHEDPIYRMPFVTYAPLTFLTPMLGAVQGALEDFTRKAGGKRTPQGEPVGAHPTFQGRLGRVAADTDAAELLMRRGLSVASGGERPSFEIRARTMRDYSRAMELLVGAMNELMMLSGTSGFASSSRLQRAWRDVSFASRHASLNPDTNINYWAHLQLGFERSPSQWYY